MCASRWYAYRAPDATVLPYFGGASKAYALLGEDALAEQHRALHLKYKPDDNARDLAWR